MSYLIQDAVARYRVAYGICRADDWERFIEVLGIRCFEDDLPANIPAVIGDNIIIIQRGMTHDSKARRVWHELSHWFLHVGDRDWWMRRPQGHITVARFERQANEFAASFPIWDGD